MNCPTSHRRHLMTGASAVLAGALLVITACSPTVADTADESTRAVVTGTGDPVSGVAVGAEPGTGTLPAGMLGDGQWPTPEATVTPQPGAWEGVTIPAGYRAVLISAGPDAASVTVTEAVRTWSRAVGVDLVEFSASGDDEVADRLEEAVALEPDLVIGAGNGVIDVFMLLTAQHLAQQFLVVGAELPEPTGNVTSVVWPGATFRGTGLGSYGDLDPASVTPDRAAAGVRAGVAGVLHGLTGVVLQLD